MALFKPFKGRRTDLDNIPKVDGHAYFCIDDGTFWIDYQDAGTIKRKQINKDDWTADIKEAIEALLQADYEQNDETKKDYIKNRPFYETSTEITKWDSKVSFEEVTLKFKYSFASVNMCKYKRVSNIVPTAEEFLTYYISSEKVDSQKFVNLEDYQYYDLVDISVKIANISMSIGVAKLIIIPTDGFDLKNLFFLTNLPGISVQSAIAKTAGIYVLVDGEYDADTTISSCEIKQLDEKFIPNIIARTSQITEAINELPPVAKSGLIEDLSMLWDTEIIFDGGGADVQVAVLDETILL